MWWLYSRGSYQEGISWRGFGEGRELACTSRIGGKRIKVDSAFSFEQMMKKEMPVLLLGMINIMKILITFEVNSRITLALFVGYTGAARPRLHANLDIIIICLHILRIYASSITLIL